MLRIELDGLPDFVLDGRAYPTFKIFTEGERARDADPNSEAVEALSGGQTIQINGGLYEFLLYEHWITTISPYERWYRVFTRRLNVNSGELPAFVGDSTVGIRIQEVNYPVFKIRPNSISDEPLAPGSLIKINGVPYVYVDCIVPDQELDRYQFIVEEL